VVAPQIVRAGSTYDVIVTIFRATSSVNVDVSLQNLRDVSVASHTTTVSAGERKTERLFYPSAFLLLWSDNFPAFIQLVNGHHRRRHHHHRRRCLSSSSAAAASILFA